MPRRWWMGLVAVLAAYACVAWGCGTAVDLGGSAPDASHRDVEAGAPGCPGFASPNMPAKCVACEAGADRCQENGCYNGWFCELSRLDCQPEYRACDAGRSDH